MITIDQNKTVYIFDVDGTLTEPRQKILEEHSLFIKSWIRDKQCFLATGSDYVKTEEQLGEDIIDLFKATFCCMGNEARGPNKKVIRKNHFLVPNDLNQDLEDFLAKSLYKTKTGRHFEARTGMLNFSIVGRNADIEQRKEYSQWDKIHNERGKIANFINNKYDDLEASVGGSISIDIIIKGHDKGQIIKNLINEGAKKIVFVGDKCSPGGNDYGLIRELERSNLDFNWFNVSGPEKTFELIKSNSLFC